MLCKIEQIWERAWVTVLVSLMDLGSNIELCYSQMCVFWCV
jgi:hypothetical protein